MEITPLICDHCKRRFYSRQGHTIPIHFESQINKITGAVTPIDEWVDYCSHACHDAAGWQWIEKDLFEKS